MTKRFCICLGLAIISTLYAIANMSKDGSVGYVIGFCVCIGIGVVGSFVKK